jgi:hypothetical protein
MGEALRLREKKCIDKKENKRTGSTSTFPMHYFFIPFFLFKFILR